MQMFNLPRQQFLCTYVCIFSFHRTSFYYEVMNFPLQVFNLSTLYIVITIYHWECQISICSIHLHIPNDCVNLYRRFSLVQFGNLVTPNPNAGAIKR